tara:strand:- start:48 stop:353 length:306 start_codon:yes stop_codon:yes gene_type:complete
MRFVTIIRNNRVDISFYTCKKQLVGSSRSFVYPLSAYLANIHVQSLYKQQGYGSHILLETERCLQHSFDVSVISLLAMQPTCGDEIIRFYKKMVISYLTTI